MKRHNLTKAFALSALMVFVITGTVYAENVDVSQGGLKDNEATIVVGQNESFKNAGTVNASDNIIVNGGSFNNSGTIETGTLDILGGGHNYVNFDSGTINSSEKIIYRGTQSNHYGLSLNDTKLVTKELTIMGNSANQIGLGVTTKDNLAGVEKINIISEGGKTGLVINGQNIDVNSEIHLTHSGGTNDARIEVNNGSSATFHTVYSDGGKTKVQANGESTVKLNNVIVNSVENKVGDLSLQTNESGLTNPEGRANFELNIITIGDNSELKTAVYGNEPGANITGDNVIINLGKNAKADFGGVGTYVDENNNKKDWRGDRIYFDVDKLTINVNSTDEYNYGSLEKYKQSYEDGVFISAANTQYNPSGDKVNCDNITVVGAGEVNTGNIENDLQKLAYVVKITREYEGEESTKLPEILAPSGATVEQKPGDIHDGGKGTVGDDGNVENIETVKNPDVFGTEEVGALGLISWRNELYDMNQRLGELRDSKGEHGVWVRMVRGENDYKSLNSQYNTYQIGYDEKLSTDPRWTLGAALSYTDGDGGYNTGNFEMDHKTLTLYGSKLNNDGSYIDVVGKYSRLNHDLMNTWGNGEYDANGCSIGVEIGKRFVQSNGFWIEPQAQLTYGHVGNADYNAGDIKVAQDGIESLIGRAGLRLGKDLDNGNIYLRASYLYDFDGDTSVSFTNVKGETRSFDEDLGGSWCEVGLGTNINLSDTTHLYFDVEKTFGGDIATTWQWNAGMRWSF